MCKNDQNLFYIFCSVAHYPKCFHQNSNPKKSMLFQLRLFAKLKVNYYHSIVGLPVCLGNNEKLINKQFILQFAALSYVKKKTKL